MKSALIGAARRRLPQTRQRTRHVDLRRAVSDAYYAVFHALCQICADELIGVSRATTAEWIRVYRSVEHAKSKAKMKSLAGSHPDPNVQTFALTFVLLQEQRHLADYDPTPPSLNRQSALALIDEAEAAIKALEAVDAKERQKLVVELLFPVRSK